MAPGTRDDEAPESPRPPSVIGKVFRAFAFIVLAGTAVVILTAVVLLPDYAGLQDDLYLRDQEVAATADLQALRSVQERMLAEGPNDEVFITRLAMWHYNLWPMHEMVARAERGKSGPPPGTILLPPRKPPTPPNETIARAAARVAAPETRRGLCLVAGGLMLLATFLSAAPRRKG